MPLAETLTPTIYFSIEESLRELDSRLLMAGMAVERGITAIIGQQWLLAENFRHLPAGIVLFKGNNNIQHDYMKMALRHGHAVASIEEEALGVALESQILRLYDDNVDRTCHLFLAQGEFQRQTLRARFPDAADRIVVVGNPRMDFLRPAFIDMIRPQTDEIRQRFAPFVLINTNVADVNSGLGDALSSFDMCIKTNYLRKGDPKGEREFRALLDWEHANAREVARLVRWLADNRPDVTTVIRPHPSERIETWRDAFAGRARIHVARDGAHLPWTLASEILIHTSCTTGMEAFAAGHAAISLCPGAHHWNDCLVANLVNPTFANHLDAAHFLASHLDSRAPASDRRAAFAAELEQHVSFTSGPLASERLVDALQDRLPAWSKGRSQEFRPRPEFKTRRQGSLQQEGKIDIALEDVRSRFKEIGRTIGRFANQSVSELGQAMYRIGVRA